VSTLYVNDTFVSKQGHLCECPPPFLSMCQYLMTVYTEMHCGTEKSSVTQTQIEISYCENKGKVKGLMSLHKRQSLLKLMHGST